MTLPKPGWLTIGLIFIALTGCRAGGQVYEVKDAPIQTASGKPLTLAQIEKAMIDAGIKQTWIMTPVKPGEIVGEYNVQSHQMHVTIPYTTKSYSILYKDSSNLRYDPAKRTMSGALGAFQGQWGTDIPLLCAGSLLILTPTLVIFLIFQRHFVKALLQGSLKG